MQSKIVEVPHQKQIIAPSKWPVKKLADVHVEALQYCEFACRYCSSNKGMHLLMRKRSLDQAVREQTGDGFDPHSSTDLAIRYAGVVDALRKELNTHQSKPGRGKTLVYSQLTDGFSPIVERDGTAREILDLLIDKTDYRIRILTKSSAVGHKKWVKYFASHRERFVVGLSIGTTDNAFAKRLEVGTSIPTSRIKALHALQDAGVPTYGMLCPVFPKVLDDVELEELVDAIRPQFCEHVWAEPYNERHNWKHVRDCFDPASDTHRWMTQVYEEGNKTLWSRYATELYSSLYRMARSDKWTDKLRYLLYESDITSDDACSFEGLDGVLLQSKPGDNGLSQHPEFRRMQLAFQGES